jgi:hypothetical protein
LKNQSDNTTKSLDTAPAGSETQSHFQVYRTYYYVLGGIVLAAVALGVGLGLGLKSSSTIAWIDIPAMQPPVAASVPSSLRPSNAQWNKPLSVGTSSPHLLSAGLNADSRHATLQAVTTNSSLSNIRDRIFGPGPTDFVTRLGMIDQRIQEFRTRSSSGNGRACLSQPAKEWNPSFLPNGVSFPMWFSCFEAMDNGNPSSGLSVYFGTKGSFAYVAELQWPTTGTNPRMAVLATISKNGTQVSAWQIITGTNSVSVFQIISDRVAGDVQISFAATEGHAIDIGCGVRMRSTSTLLWSTGEYHDPATAGNTPCSNTPTPDVCASSVTLSAQSASACSAINSFSTVSLTNVTLYTDNLISRAPLGIQTPNMPTLTSFTVMA